MHKSEVRPKPQTTTVVTTNNSLNNNKPNNNQTKHTHTREHGTLVRQLGRRSRSRSARAGLQFPVARIEGWMRAAAAEQRHGTRMGAGAPVYLSA
eukprot:SAG22_NODE_16432_length_325_cov_0.915929_1_plen_94_part_01